MAYYLAIETQPAEYTALKLKKPKYFNEVDSEENQYECTLEEINEYTTKYPNSKILAQHLASLTILSYRDTTKPLAIFYVNGIEVRKINGNILYSESIPYLNDPTLIKKYIVDKGLARDFDFFKQLGLTQDNMSIITYMINTLVCSMENEKIYNESESNQIPLPRPNPKIVDEQLILKIAKSLIYDCKIGETGDLIFSNKINYEKLHTITSFIIEYESKLSQVKSDDHKRVRKPHRP